MLQTRVPMPPRPMATISLFVPQAVFDGLVALAHKAGHPRDLYAANLLIAAYSARRGPTGDAELDEAVARLEVKHPGQFNTDVNAEIEHLARALGQERKSRLIREEADRAEIAEAQEKIAQQAARILQLIDDLAAARRDTARHPAATPNKQHLPVTGPEIGFVPPEALPSPDPASDLADCTRRTILALAAAGLRAVEIARDTDTPLHVVKLVIDQRQKSGRRA